MFNSEFWMTLAAIVAFILGMIGGMLVDWEAERRAAKKEYIKNLEIENKKLKGKLSFYRTLLEEKDGRQDM